MSRLRPGGCAPGCPQRQEWWGELPEKSSGVLRERGAEVTPGVGGHLPPGAQLPGLY